MERFLPKPQLENSKVGQYSPWILQYKCFYLQKQQRQIPKESTHWTEKVLSHFPLPLQRMRGSKRDSISLDLLLNQRFICKTELFYASQLFMAMTKIPGKNNSEEEKFIWRSWFQRFGPQSDNFIALGPRWGRTSSQPGSKETKKSQRPDIVQDHAPNNLLPTTMPPCLQLLHSNPFKLLIHQ